MQRRKVDLQGYSMIPCQGAGVIRISFSRRGTSRFLPNWGLNSPEISSAGSCPRPDSSICGLCIRGHRILKALMDTYPGMLRPEWTRRFRAQGNERKRGRGHSTLPALPFRGVNRLGVTFSRIRSCCTCRHPLCHTLDASTRRKVALRIERFQAGPGMVTPSTGIPNPG